MQTNFCLWYQQKHLSTYVLIDHIRGKSFLQVTLANQLCFKMESNFSRNETELMTLKQQKNQGCFKKMTLGNHFFGFRTISHSKTIWQQKYELESSIP